MAHAAAKTIDFADAAPFLEDGYLLHECRRLVRSPQVIEELVTEMLEQYATTICTIKGDPARGTEDTEAPLVSDRTRQRWEECKRHLDCIQDPPGIDVYIKKAERVANVRSGWVTDDARQ